MEEFNGYVIRLVGDANRPTIIGASLEARWYLGERGIPRWDSSLLPNVERDQREDAVQ